MLPEGIMYDEDKMTIDERLKYLRRTKRHYVKANRKDRGRLLDEMVTQTDLHRKSLVRLVSSTLEHRPRRRQWARTHGPEVDDALRIVVESMDHICAERLAPNLTWLAHLLDRHGEMDVSPSLAAQLSRRVWPMPRVV
jgi:hypothetical protein